VGDEDLEEEEKVAQDVGAYYIPKMVNLSSEGIEFISKCLLNVADDRILWNDMMNNIYLNDGK
jgi:hypothetical protein